MKDHLLPLFISLLIGTLSLLLGVVWPEESAIPRWLVSVSVFFVSFILTFITSEIIKLVLDFNKVIDIKESLDLVTETRQLIPGSSLAIQDLTIRYSKRFWGDIATEKQYVLIADYLKLLEESLQVATRNIFATSLITPSTWLTDKLYQDYLQQQIEKKHQFPSMNMTRVFILRKEEFFSDPNCKNVVERHLKVGIKIGICETEDLEDADVRDLVSFEENGNKWIIEAGRIPKDITTANLHTPIAIRLHCIETALHQLFGHWKKKIDRYTLYLSNYEELNKEICKFVVGTDDND